PRITDAFPNFRFGLFLCLYVAVLHTAISLPIRRIKHLLQITYHIDVSASEIHNMIQKTGEEFGPQYKSMQKEIKKMKAIYADETSWHINGKMHWLWISISENRMYYHIHKSRGKRVPDKILKGFAGVLLSDFYNAYSQGKISQKCLVHLLGDVFKWKTVKYYNSKELQKFALRLKNIVLDAIYIKEKSKQNKIKYEKKTQRLISKDREDGEVKKMCKRLHKHLNSLFTFLEYNVDFSNNRAERGLRSCVVARKISYGSRSKKAALCFATLKTITETCKLNAKDFFEYGKDYLSEKITSESQTVSIKHTLR
ncbi:MAG TPA: IS66 family transposase, partial [Chromatiaceae bacterium]|nr:IS66 family transposase [Chromatiaceae bacterium]